MFNAVCIFLRHRKLFVRNFSVLANTFVVRKCVLLHETESIWNGGFQERKDYFITSMNVNTLMDYVSEYLSTIIITDKNYLFYIPWLFPPVWGVADNTKR